MDVLNNTTYGYGYGYGYQPIQYNTATPMPLNQNALSEDEIKQMLGTKSKKIDLTLDPVEVLRECCTHKRGGVDMVQQLQDGRVYCPLCGATWTPVQAEKEEVEEAVNKVIDLFQTAKWLGDLPVEMTREYFPMGGLLRKFPSIYKYGMDNFSKYYNNNPYQGVQDASAYYMYDSIMGYSNPWPGMQSGYAPNAYQQVQPGVAPAPAGYQPQVGQPVPQPGVAPAPAGYQPGMIPAPAPAASPMDISSYGVNPYAVNQQFVNQAAAMVPGGIPGAPSPYFGPAGYQPQVGQPIPQPGIAPAPTAPAPAATETKTETVKV